MYATFIYIYVSKSKIEKAVSLFKEHGGVLKQVKRKRQGFITARLSKVILQASPKVDDIQETILSDTINKDLWDDKLANLKYQLDRLDSEINKISEELNQIKNSRIVDTSFHIQIIKEFNEELDDRSLDKQKELVQTLMREVESTVKNKEGSYTGEGEIIIT